MDINDCPSAVQSIVNVLKISFKTLTISFLNGLILIINPSLKPQYTAVPGVRQHKFLKYFLFFPIKINTPIPAKSSIPAKKHEFKHELTLMNSLYPVIPSKNKN
jgi:hypothetical protein